MSRVKTAFHDEISNRCEVCGCRYDTGEIPCDEPACPIPEQAFLNPAVEVAAVFDSAIARAAPAPE